ncbi:T9SS type B sorting domain-containing protein [Nonlabens ulvanivorans]|uniref:T9SS type B sorting domain-containing protein n=5 Tax=Nonlabens ulvanivorans TaxID=906888 RepID=UPI003297F97C
MKKILLAFLFILPLLSNAQGEASWWFFGHNGGVDFNSGVPLGNGSGALFTFEGCSTISDECGNLLMYSDGSTVWNRNHVSMPNGTGLSGNSSSAQSAIIIPDLQVSNVYFVVTISAGAGLQYSIVNMNLDAGLGDVVPGRKNIQIQQNTQEKVTASLNANGDRYWIVTFDDPTYTAYQAGGGLIDTNPARVVSSTIPVTSALTDARGYIRLSPDGSKIANTSIGSAGSAFLCDFDNSTGVVSNPVTLSNGSSASNRFYGAEFSPNSQLLYLNANSQDSGNGCGTSNVREVIQFNINGPAGWQSSPVALGNVTGTASGRGALQLGIDGKIYQARTCLPWLGVIRDPNSLGTGANYVDDGVALAAGTTSREGLPPFITSFFEPSFLATDANMGSGGGNNNPETDFCDGTPIQFDSSGSGLCATATVNWDFGDGTTDNTFNPVHTFPAPGDYTVTLTVTSGFYSNTAVDVISIYEIPVANPVNNVFLCDSDMDGTEDRDLSTSETAQVIGAQTNPNFAVTYYLTQNNADNNTGAIALPYTFNVGTTTIYARITNDLNAASRECYETTSFDVIVANGSGATAPADLVVCDDDNDGFFTFDLTSVETEVLNGLPAAQFTITYHTTLTDAQNGTADIPNPASYVNTIANGPETIFVRLEDMNPGGCNSTTDFDISVFDTPTANVVPDSSLCDTGNDNTEDVTLTSFDADVLLAQTNTNYVITYHLTQADADADTGALTSPHSMVGTTTFYVRIDNSSNEPCYDTSSFTITLDAQPVANPVTEYRLCDDVSNNGSEVFDLSTKDIEVLGAQNPADFNVLYFVSQADADAGIAGGASPVMPSYSSAGQTMYIRIENATNASCYETTTFDLVVDDIPVAAAPMTLVVCDDTTNDGIEDITLSQFDADVLNGQTQTTFVISYHASQVDADNDASPLPAVYQVSLGTTTVYARIDNSDNETCASVVSFDIILNEQAIANTVTEYRICDDASNDGLEDFDLSTKDVEVLGAQTAANFNIEYFTSQADADLGSVGGATPLTIPYNSGDDTIFVRIETIANADCYNTTSFDIFVDELPIAGTPANVIVCDDPSNDGVEDVNLAQFDAEILNGQTNPSFVVSYHASQADADNDTAALASPFTVSTTTPNLFARIDNGDNNSCYTTTSFQFVISPTPTANTVQNMIACDDAGNDGSEIFDLSNADAQVLNGQNAASFNITYHPSQADADANTAALPTSYPSSTTTPETVYVRIESNTNTQCYDTTSFTLTVSEQPTAGVALDQRGCDDVSNDGIEEFDFSNVDVDILNGQSAADFTVTYHTSQANADSGANALTFPYTNVSQSQTIYARIENNVNTDCYDTSTFGIEVFARPVIANQGPITICAGIDEVLDAGAGYNSYLWSTGEMTQTITVNQGGDYDVTVFNADGCDSTATITVIESDVAVIERIDIGQFEVNTNQLTAIVTGSGDYEYSLDDFVYQDSPRFNNLYPGYYTIYVKDKNGCGTVSMDAVIIGGPPYFTPNQDGYHDTWQVIAIETVPDANIYIFDRYGKLIKQIDAQGIGWDGTYNGNPMPSSDYWYLVELSDGRSFKGHFALKR